jgi:ABC-type nitrate/sulfonate/bicarbonate transport system permease component
VARPGPIPLERAAAPLAGLAAALFGLVALEVLVRLDIISKFLISPPSEVIETFGRLVTQEDLAGHFLQTLAETFAAAALATLIGIPIGLALYRFRLLRAACENWVAGLASAPLVLLYPLFLVMFGRTVLTVVIMSFLSGLPAVVLKTSEGLRGVRPVFLDVGHSFKITDTQQFWKILLPAAMPSIFTGIRLSLLFALISVVGVEFLINFGGLGELIADLADRFDLPGMYGAICFVTVVSACFFFAIETVERWLRPV